MNAIEQGIVAYVQARHAEGELSVTAPEIMRAIIPSDRPRLGFKPGYKHALQRLGIRQVLNAIDESDGTPYYFIGNFPTKELRESLGL